MHWNYLKDSLKILLGATPEFLIQRSGTCPRIYISSKLPGDTDAIGPRPPFWEPPNWAKNWKERVSGCMCKGPGVSMSLAVSHHRIKGQNGRNKVKETGEEEIRWSRGQGPDHTGFTG